MNFHVRSEGFDEPGIEVSVPDTESAIGLFVSHFCKDVHEKYRELVCVHVYLNPVLTPEGLVLTFEKWESFTIEVEHDGVDVSWSSQTPIPLFPGGKVPCHLVGVRQ